MATVVLTLVFIPFGKFFHVIQRPASVGVEVYKQTSAEARGRVRLPPLRGAARDRRLRPAISRPRWTSSGSAYGEWIETCPRCKRLERGQAYLREVNRGFR